MARFKNDIIKARLQGDFPLVAPTEIKYVDVAPNQIASIAASLIPFLENDDANRALMGSNMMRQAVPLMRPNSPIVGTGLEGQVARDSRVLVTAEADGVVEYVDGNEIHIRYHMDENDRLVSFEDDVKVYDITKFAKTNQGTCINLKPSCPKGCVWSVVTSSWKGTLPKRESWPGSKHEGGLHALEGLQL